MHARRCYFPTACLLCTVGFVTTAWISIALTPNLFWLALSLRSTHYPSYRITCNRWHSGPFLETIKTLGIILDQTLTLNRHVSALSRNIHFYTRALRHIIACPGGVYGCKSGCIFGSVLFLSLPRSEGWPHHGLWCNPGIMPTPLCMECQHLTRTNYSLPKILSLVWFCLLFAIFQQVSDSVSSSGFLFTTE